MSLSTIVFHVQDPAAKPVAGALLSAVSPTVGPWQGVTGQQDPQRPGDFQANLTPAHYDITISALGFQTRTLPADLANPGTVTIGLIRPVTPPLPPAGDPPSLQIKGRDFVDKTGKRQVLIGTDMFLAFRQYLDGVDLSPFFRESRELGFNLWRVFFQGSAAQNGVLQLSPTEPGYYDKVQPFARLVNSQGIALLATIGIDNQDVKSPPEHWSHLYTLIEGTATIASKANEWTKNLAGMKPDQFPNPTGKLLWSQGSDQQDQAPFKPVGSVMEFHPVRNYVTAMRDAVASPTELYEVQHYGDLPLLFDEPGRMGSVDPSPSEFSDPKHCYEYARIASALCAGVVFHNRAGQSGQLMPEGTRTCAAGFVRGMQL